MEDATQLLWNKWWKALALRVVRPGREHGPETAHKQKFYRSYTGGFYCVGMFSGGKYLDGPRKVEFIQEIWEF